MKIKVYVAGKVSKNSVFNTHYWRDGFCKELSQKTGFEIVNLDPIKFNEGFKPDQKDCKLLVGRDCFLIKNADLVIVNLTDDISVGGSQEMLIAKFFKKPLVGIALKGGKFSKEEAEVFGQKIKNWIDPFVSVPCDKIVENISELAEFVKEFFSKPKRKVKDLRVLREALEYYEKQFHHLDKYFQDK